MTQFVAVILKAGQASQRKKGDWACFVEKTKKDAVAAAVKARDEWEKKEGCGPYEIFVGELTQQVNTTVIRKLSAIKEPKREVVKSSALLAAPYRDVLTNWTRGVLAHKF